MSRALWHINAQSSEWKDVEVNQRATSDLVSLATSYSMVSTGTERLIASGMVPEALAKQMAVPYMEGGFSFPIKYGYACSGQTVDGVFYHYMHPHQDSCQIHKDGLFEISNGLPAFKIPLISNMETALNAIWDSELKPSDTIAVCGFGNIGSLLANTLRHYVSKKVVVIEKDEWRSQKARDLGWPVYKDDEDFDVIFHTTGSASGLQFCIDHLKEEGKVIELSWYGTKKVSLTLGEKFHYKRLSIRSSQVGKISPIVSDEVDYFKRKEIAADLLLNPSYDELVTNIVSWKDAPKLFRDIRQNELPSGLIWLIKYD